MLSADSSFGSLQQSLSICARQRRIWCLNGSSQLVGPGRKKPL